MELTARQENAESSGQFTVEYADVTGGRLRGSVDNDIVCFKGIPFAAPPIGSLRWKPPQPAEAWSEVRDATFFRDRCIQNADLGIFASPGGTEDCLYLNVYAPADAMHVGATLPVLVWMHGGSFWVGAGSDYDGACLAREGKAVVVTINYRLGLLGWFAHPALEAEGDPVGNYGLMDQQFALRWVQENIAAFGGDPGNVTIFGESGGGACVFAHVLCPGSAGLFRHAIAMSGAALVLRYPAFGAPKPFEVAKQLGADFGRAVGCADDDADALRSLPVETILAQQFPYLHNQPMIDGVTVTEHPADLMKTGALNCVSLINGTTRDEGTFFAALMEAGCGPMDEQAYQATLVAFYGEELAPKVAAQYPTAAYPTPSEAYADAVTSSLFACTAHAVNGWLASKTRLYAYEFADRTSPSYAGPTSFALGAAHSFELQYLFTGFCGAGLYPSVLNEDQARLARAMINYWSSLHKSDESDWGWPQYQPDRDNVMLFTLPEPRVSEGQFAKVHKSDFWDATGLY